MTDLISSLAESIVALINAKPQSPTKDEVEQLLMRWLLVIDHGTANYRFPGESQDAKNARIRQWERGVNGPLPDIVRELCEYEPNAAPKVKPVPGLLSWLAQKEKERGPDACGIPCGHRRIHPELQALRPCPGSTDGSHSFSSHDPATDMYRCPCGAAMSGLDLITRATAQR